jgi:hypothetical protein
MKTIMIILACVASTAWAGTITIDTPAADDKRIADAYGEILYLKRPATTQEIQQAIIVWLNQTTVEYERRKFSPAPIRFSTPVPVKAATPAPTATPKKKKK